MCVVFEWGYLFYKKSVALQHRSHAKSSQENSLFYVLERQITKSSQKISTHTLTVLMTSVILHLEQKGDLEAKL